MFKPTRIEASKSHRRLLALIPVAVLALIVVSVFVSLRATATPQSMPSAPAISVEAVAVAAAAPGNPAVETTPRELVAMEAAGLVTLARPRLSTTPRELVAMEAAGLVTLTRPRLSTTPRELVAMEAAGLVTLARPIPPPSCAPPGRATRATSSGATAPTRSPGRPRLSCACIEPSPTGDVCPIGKRDYCSPQSREVQVRQPCDWQKTDLAGS